MSTDLDELRERLCDTDETEVIGAIIDIGKQRIRPLADDVAPFLSHSSAAVRGAAAKTMGFHFRAKKYLNALKTFAPEEEDVDARMSGIFGWSAIMTNTRDEVGMRALEGWLRDKEQPWGVRISALHGLLNVAGVPSREWPATTGMTDIDREAPWALVDTLMGRMGGQ